MRCAIWALALWLAVGSVWQPATKRTAAGRRIVLARCDRKIDIFQDRHLLNSARSAMAGFLLHRPAVSVKFCMLDLEVYVAGVGGSIRVSWTLPNELRPKTKTRPLDGMFNQLP